MRNETNWETPSEGGLTDEEKENLITKDDVKDNLISEDEDKPLSAKQGKILKDMFEAKLQETLAAITASKGCINANPYFILGETDYKKFLESYPERSKLVTNVVDGNPYSLYIEGGAEIAVNSASNHKMVLNRGKKYNVKARLKVLIDDIPSDQDDVLFFLGVISYDSDDKTIYPSNLPLDNTKFGILTEDLNAGDTQIVFRTNDTDNITGKEVFPDNQDLSNKNILGYKKQQNGDYSYIGENNRIYENLLYSRWKKARAYDDDSIVDNGDGTYTLSLLSGWETEPLKKGDVVLNSKSGGTYTYWKNSYVVADGKFQTVESGWKNYEETRNTKDGEKMVRNGAAYIKKMVLLNYAKRVDGTYSSDTDNVKTWMGSLSYEYEYQ